MDPRAKKISKVKLVLAYDLMSGAWILGEKKDVQLRKVMDDLTEVSKAY